MSYKKYIPLAFLLLISTFSLAQYEKLLNEARRYYDKSLLFEARQSYGKILQKDSMNRIANLEMAELLFFDIEDYDGAYTYLNRYLRSEKDTSPPFIYALAKCEEYRGDYTASEKHFKRFNEKTKNEGKDELYRDEVRKNLASLDYLRRNGEINSRVKVVNLGSAINTRYPEYVPVVNENENVLMFTSKRKNELNAAPSTEDERYREDMYISKKNGPNFESPAVLPSLDRETQQLKNSPRNESLISLSPDGKTLFLFKKGSIYSSEFKVGSWSEPKILDEKIISEAYENHASVTADGKTIFFTSERKGGSGGLDIYKAEKAVNGSWNKPVNLGNEINTSADEESPYIAPDGKTLFFSSNGLPGYGAHDIYKCEWDGTKFGKPVNMGLPFNSVADDIFFYPHQDLSEGFLSSNRKGGLGDFDIYRFYYTDKPGFKNVPGQPLSPELSSKVSMLQENFIKDPAKTGKALSGLKSDPGVAGIYFRLNDSLVSEDPELIRKNLKRTGKNKLEVELIKNCDTCLYRQFYVSSGFITGENSAVPNDELVSPEADLVLSGIKKVYFEYGKFSLTDAAIEVMDENVVLLRKAPAVKIVIYGHADSRGSEALNRDLARQRAQEVSRYLLSKGISKKRISTVISKGKDDPEVDCGGNCTEEQHAQNRRVEIKAAK
ncbi:MAG: OmpA family protein [Bacteroidia bacterium]